MVISNIVETVHDDNVSLTHILLTLLRDIPAHERFMDTLVEETLQEMEETTDGSPK